MEAIHRMPTNSPTPETKTVLVLGRADGGRNGAPGGLCFYSKGQEIRLEPGDTVDIPVKVAQHFIAEGLALDPDATPAEVENDGDPDPLANADLDLTDEVA
jgi:hypothetical protein